MRNRNRNRNWKQRHSQQWATAGACLAVMSSTVLSSTTEAATNTNLDAQTQQAMIDAINDEYHARAFYNAVMDKFGEIRPFSNIVHAETRHVKRWNQLFKQYGLPIPEDSFAGKIAAPETLQAACQMAIEAEIANVKMYDKFLDFVQESDLRDTFTQLRYVSQNKHKVAFERCLNSRGSKL